MYTVFVGGILMESNSFNPVPSTRETFTTFLEGGALATMRGTSLELGGIYDCLDRQADVQIAPGFFAQACTSGPLAAGEFDYLSDKLLDSLHGAGPVDGVLLVLHGAMQSERVEDCEGYLIQAARGIVGDHVPVVASFDLHARMTELIVMGLDGLSGYHTYPHIDHFECGGRAANSLLTLLRQPCRPHRICRRIPLIMSCENSNTIDSPVVPVMDSIRSLLARPNVLSGSLFLTQPWLDSPALGCSIAMFVRDAEQVAAVGAAIDNILTYLWNRREAFYPPMPDIREAVSQLAGMNKPIFLVDYGDVPNAGSTGDGTAVLRALREADLPWLSVVVVADAQSVRLAVRLGVGGTGLFQIGGSGPPGSFNERIPVTAEVLRLDDRPFTHLGPAQKGFINRPGQRALLRAANLFIILTEVVTASHDRNTLLSLGLDPCEMGVISMRATHSFLSCYEGLIGSWFYVNTPGFSTRDLTTLTFRHVQRPIYPLDNLDQIQIIEVI